MALIAIRSPSHPAQLLTGFQTSSSAAGRKLPLAQSSSLSIRCRSPRASLKPGGGREGGEPLEAGPPRNRRPHEVEEALAARLGPSRGPWLQESGKDKSQANAMGSPCLYIKRNIRQYEEINYEGTIVVFGDVGLGSVIRAGGDVLVLGRLTGEVHAGLNKDRRASVFAWAMEPSMIGIANELVLGPEGGAQSHPEIASISDLGSISPAGCVVAGAAGSIEPAMVQRSSRGRREFTSEGEGVEDVIQQMASKHLPSVQWKPVEHGGEGPTIQSKGAARVAIFTGAYITVVGLATIAFPQLVFGLLFDVKAVSRGWIQVLGVLCLVFGINYMGAAQGDLRGYGALGFYLSTVFSRTVLFFAFCALVAFGSLQESLLVLAAINLVGALSMLWALRSQAEAS